MPGFINHASGLPFVAKETLQMGMFLRTQRPDDHADFQFVLSHCTAKAVWQDPKDRDSTLPVEFDTAWHEVDWWFHARN